MSQRPPYHAQTYHDQYEHRHVDQTACRPSSHHVIDNVYDRFGQIAITDPPSSSTIHAGPSRTSTYVDYSPIQAIPAPQPKVSYEAPVFRTFQDRKRAKEMAWAATSQSSASIISNPPFDLRSGSFPSGGLINSGSLADLPTYNASYTPRPPSAVPSMDQPNRLGRALPQAPARTINPTPIDKIAHTTPNGAPQRVVLGETTVRSKPSLPLDARSVLERSDTVSSIKSLDRMDFSNNKRPLPRTPVGVNTSKSLDRGIPASERGITDRKEWRRQPSTVQEEDEQSSSTSRSPVISTPSLSTPPPPIFVVGSNGSSDRNGYKDDPLSVFVLDPSQITPAVVPADIPVISVGDIDEAAKMPARFSPLPTFNMPIDNQDDEVLSSGPGVALSSAIPTISVTTDDNRHQQHLPTGSVVCAGCDQGIIGRIVNAMKRRFHPHCFICNECGELLEHVSSFEWEGRAYCHLDYHDKFAPRCFHCKTPIIDARFVTLSDPILGERCYHEMHFFCSECGDPFLDPSKSSAPGTERAQQDDECETNPFVIQKGHPYCEKCHTRLHKPKCKSCREPIPDVGIRAMNAHWHKSCFVCAQCGSDFANNLFFPQDGQVLCTSCYGETL